MQVLAVDDKRTDLELLTHALKQWGYDVKRARNGREAMHVLRSSPCRIIITDWEMPEVDGLELCRRIRAEQFGGYRYVILLTCHAAQDEIVSGLAAGADDFLAKPFNPGELLARLRGAERVLSLDTRNLTIFALARLAEARDPETIGHLERVQGYSRVIAEQLSRQHQFANDIDGRFASLIYLTSPLHDIGKVGIPDRVLLKPGRLTRDEFEVMKRHTVLGMRTLDDALRRFPEADFLRMARDIVAAHHEHFDGSGYPYGLAKDDIPLAARIVAVADVYDALTSQRPYKSAYSHDYAASVINDAAGKQFDPCIVDAFLESEPQIQAVRDAAEYQVTVESMALGTTPAFTIADEVLLQQQCAVEV